MAVFIGGPCAGRTAPSTTALTLSCGGVTYTLLDDLNYHANVRIAGDTLDTKQIGRAWNRLMHVPAVEAPAAIRRSRAARARLRHLSR